MTRRFIVTSLFLIFAFSINASAEIVQEEGDPTSGQCATGELSDTETQAYSRFTMPSRKQCSGQIAAGNLGGYLDANFNGRTASSIAEALESPAEGERSAQ